jgi:hypothetical protein
MISYLEDRLYSAAFNDGFDYAVEKLFADYNWYTGVTDTDHGKALRQLRDRDETLQDYSPREDRLMRRLAEKEAKELDREGLDDQTIRYRTADKAAWKVGGLTGLGLAGVGAGIGALTGHSRDLSRLERAGIGAAEGGLAGLIGGGLVGGISAHNSVNDMMDQRDKHIFDKRLKEKVKKELREEKTKKKR